MHRLQRGRGTPDEAPRRAAARRLHSLRSCCVWDLLISGRGLERHETGTVERPVAMPSHGRRRRQQGGRDPLMSRSGSGGGGSETLEGLKFQFHERRLWRNFSNAGGNRPGTGICIMQGFSREEDAPNDLCRFVGSNFSNDIRESEMRGNCWWKNHGYLNTRSFNDFTRGHDAI